MNGVYDTHYFLLSISPTFLLNEYFMTIFHYAPR